MTDPDNPAREIVKPELKDQVTNMIISGQEGEIGGERPVDSGSGVAAFGNTNEYLLQTQVKNITRGTYYKLIGIAKARLSNGTPIGEYSEILVSTSCGCKYILQYAFRPVRTDSCKFSFR